MVVDKRPLKIAVGHELTASIELQNAIVYTLGLKTDDVDEDPAVAYPPGPTGTGLADTPCTWTGCPQPPGTVGGNQTECKVRQLAYEHALALMPSRAPLRTYLPPARSIYSNNKSLSRQILTMVHLTGILPTFQHERASKISGLRHLLAGVGTLMRCSSRCCVIRRHRCLTPVLCIRIRRWRGVRKAGRRSVPPILYIVLLAVQTRFTCMWTAAIARLTVPLTSRSRACTQPCRRPAWLRSVAV